MTGPVFDPDEDLRAPVSPHVLARARPVGPEPETRPDPGLRAEPEPWELPLQPPPPPRLSERTVDEIYGRIRELSLDQARAFLRAYRSIPRSGLDFGGWAQGPGSSADHTDEPPTLDDIVKARAVLRDGASREARANGADLDPDAITARAREAVIEALSHASLRGGGIEEATVAAEVAAQDATVALAARPWISEWRFDELVEPWVQAYSVIAEEGRSFDVLGAIALALGVLALATFGFGRSSLSGADPYAAVFAALAVLVMVLRWRTRRGVVRKAATENI